MTATLPPFDELNVIREQVSQVVTGMVEAETAPEQKRFDRRPFEDMIFELLTMSYVYGLEMAGLDLNRDIPLNESWMLDSVSATTAGETFAQRIEEHVAAANRDTAGDPAKTAQRLTDEIATVAETEAHRVMNEAVMDSAEWFLLQDPTANVWMRW